jgi:hypothetical protein
MTAPSAVRAQKKKVLLLCLQIPTEIIEPHPPLQAQQATGSKRDTGRKEFPVLPASSSSSSFSLTFFLRLVCFPGKTEGMSMRWTFVDNRVLLSFFSISDKKQQQQQQQQPFSC